MLFGFVALTACKPNDSQPPGKKYTLPNNKLKQVVEVYSSCPYDYVSPITSYQGVESPVNLNSDPGFGRYADDAYDRGYKAGYMDGVFYHNYFGTSQETSICTDMQVKLLVGNVSSPGMQKQVNLGYVLQPGETTLGPIVVSSGCIISWVLKRCILRNQASPKWLRMQYEFNNSYPGRAPDQVSFDAGRLAGYNVCINFEPVAPMPE